MNAPPRSPDEQRQATIERALAVLAELEWAASKTSRALNNAKGMADDVRKALRMVQG